MVGTSAGKPIINGGTHEEGHRPYVGGINILQGGHKAYGGPPQSPPTRENLVMGSWPFLKNLDNRSGGKFSF